MSVVLVTGAGGFIGRHLCPALSAQGYEVRSVTASMPPGPRTYATAATVPFQEVDAVVHLGGMAHANVAGATRHDLTRVNVDETLALYRQARAGGVRRFVWMSSIKVLGDESSRPFAADDPRNPPDAYAESKALAEEALLEEHEPGTLAIVRPPLVYGPGVKANFLALLRWGVSGWPLPLRTAAAPRAWLAVENLTAFIVRLLDPPQAMTADYPCIWHLRDEEETGVADMLRAIARAAGVPSRLLPVPTPLLYAAAGLIGRRADAQRLLAPLQVDMTPTTGQLGFRIPVRQADALSNTVDWYLGSR